MCAMVKESNSTRWPANNSQKYTKNVQTRVTLGVLSLTHFPTFYNQPTWQMLRHGKGFGHSLVTPSYKRKVTRVFFFQWTVPFFRTRLSVHVVLIFQVFEVDTVIHKTRRVCKKQNNKKKNRCMRNLVTWTRQTHKNKKTNKQTTKIEQDGPKRAKHQQLFLRIT